MTNIKQELIEKYPILKEKGLTINDPIYINNYLI